MVQKEIWMMDSAAKRSEGPARFPASGRQASHRVRPQATRMWPYKLLSVVFLAVGSIVPAVTANPGVRAVLNLQARASSPPPGASQKPEADAKSKETTKSPEDAESQQEETAEAPAADSAREAGGADVTPRRPRRARPGTRVLMPGSQAWKKPPKASSPPSTRGPGPRAPSELRSPKTQLAREGTLYWTGKLQQNRVIVIQAGEADSGMADGDLLPGVPVDVRTFSPAVTIVEPPSPKNGWKRVSIRCLRTTKRSVTINIEWSLRR